MKKNLLIVTSFVLFLGSCTIQKRLHMDGYYVSWHSNGKNAKGVDNHGSDQIPNESRELLSSPENRFSSVEAIEAEQPIAVVSTESPENSPTSAFTNELNITNTENEKVSKRQIRQAIREHRKEAKEIIKELKSNGVFSGSSLTSEAATDQTSAPDTLLLVLICLLGLSPIAMYLYEDSQWTARCTTNLILWLLCGLPGFIHALVVILGKK